MGALVATSPADLRDQRWLNEQIAAIDKGVEAVLDIARNWTDGRNVARLHPGVSAVEYIKARVVHPLGKGIVLPLLEASDWSNRQIAEVAGVAPSNVDYAERQLRDSHAVARPDRTLGADGKYRPARVVRAVATEVLEEEPIEERTYPAYWADLNRIATLIEALNANADAPVVAATVPDRRRATTAKRLRRLGTYLGSIAWTLERTGEPS